MRPFPRLLAGTGILFHFVNAQHAVKFVSHTCPAPSEVPEQGLKLPRFKLVEKKKFYVCRLCVNGSTFRRNLKHQMRFGHVWNAESLSRFLIEVHAVLFHCRKTSLSCCASNRPRWIPDRKRVWQSTAPGWRLETEPSSTSQRQGESQGFNTITNTRQNWSWNSWNQDKRTMPDLKRIRSGTFLDHRNPIFFTDRDSKGLMPDQELSASLKCRLICTPKESCESRLSVATNFAHWYLAGWERWLTPSKNWKFEVWSFPAKIHLPWTSFYKNLSFVQ